MERDTVYLAIDSERYYQNRVWPVEHSVGEEILLLEDILQKLRSFWAGNSDEDPTSMSLMMDQMRKIAAVAIRSMEENGTRPRK